MASATDAAVPSTKPVNIGTRRSPLARVQAEAVQETLKKQFPDRAYEIHAIATNLGDIDKTSPLYEMGQQGKSLWTHELEVLLLDGKLDLVVHCVKDMPTQLPPTLSLASVIPRGDPRDALIVSPKLSATHKTLDSLPDGSTIGTSSVRRTAQLRRLYPNLKFLDCRGNVGTRLAKLDADDSPYTALVLAAAGLLRMGWDDRITSYLSSKEGGMLYAVGQGALGLQIREGDEETLKIVEQIACERTTRETVAERSLMRTLEGGCSVPIGVEVEWEKKEGSETELSDNMIMRAIVVSVDGRDAAEATLTHAVTSREAAEEFGRVMAKTLTEKGADKILQKIILTRRNVEGQ